MAKSNFRIQRLSPKRSGYFSDLGFRLTEAAFELRQLRQYV